VILSLVDIGEIVDHNCLNFFFITFLRSMDECILYFDVSSTIGSCLTSV